MAPGWFGRLQRFRGPGSRARSDHAVIPRAPAPTEDTQPNVCIAAPIEAIRPPSTYADVPAPDTTRDYVPNSTGTPPVWTDDQTTSSCSLTGRAGEILTELSSSQPDYRPEDPAEANQPDAPPSSEDVSIVMSIKTIHPLSPATCNNADSSISDSTRGGSLQSSTDIPVLTAAQAMGPHSAQGNVDAPACTGKVSSVSPSSQPVYRLDPAKAKEYVEHIRRFRILVVGRANAGKTTILQRVCNTVDQPEIFNGKGEKVDAGVVQASLTRGYHDVEDELVFRSNPGFVFHDSCGFEAANAVQFDRMKKFVMDRAKALKLDERIHAIWFCIPWTDSERMVTASEMKFFDECDTGHVPVIVLLTKTDALELEALEELEGQGSSVDDEERVADVQREILDTHTTKLKGWLNKRRFPPHDYLSLGGMEKEDADCAPLLTCTANVLNGEGLQQLLISTQQSNLGLCVEFAIVKTLKMFMERTSKMTEPTTISVMLSFWFPYAGWKQHQPTDQKLVHSINPSMLSLGKKMPILSTSRRYSMKFVVEHGIGCTLVFEYLYFLLQVQNGTSHLEEDLTVAVREYQTSGVQANVNQCVDAAFEEHGEDVDSLCPILVDVARKNQMSKMILNKQ